ncbi:hypothetical protein [Sulfuricurvum sp.]|uniref:hypothetical protein n=1 Tax=Sulfuricurvum sp. TaxID=2025608 RepID=UPI002603D959|nr:hypothetical protein [Sulfuricurvum sp.]MDD2267168.1 hypothetical protein [Sulfuricurvum sp.]MDD2784196.1 hypothetical protein [Sulfuricurvum sp.]
MQAERKQIIRYALDYDIQDINTYSGYKGDLIVKIATKDMKAVVAIRKFAMDLSIKEVVVKQNAHLEQFEVFCVTPDKDVYHLKTEEIIDEIHSEHPVDPWDRSKLK